jgi:regulator of sigma E protease
MLEFLLGNSFLSAVIAFGIILIPAIIIHELGHFFAAKMVGINVLEFGIGFPPRMVRLFMWGETEFTLNWLPIGGFVRPLGEDMIGPVATEEEIVYEEDGKPKAIEYISEREELIARGVPEDKLISVNEAKPLHRIFFMAAGAGANFVSAIVLFIVAALLGLPTEVGARVQILEIPSDSPYAVDTIEAGDAIEQVDGELYPTTSAMLAALRGRAGEPVTLTMRRFDDEFGEYEATVVPSTANAEGYLLVLDMIEDMPAAEAGILPGDYIVALDGHPIDQEDPMMDLHNTIAAFAGQEMRLTVLRDGEQLELTMIPAETVSPTRGRIGVSLSVQYDAEDGVVYRTANPQVDFIPLPFAEAVTYGFQRTGEVLGMIISLPGQLISGAISPEEARPVSVVGISQIGSQFLQSSVENGAPSIILDFLGLVSIFLGFTNLLPFPPLDGGRIVFVLVEMVRGKPVPIQVENLVYRIGIALLLGLGLIVIIYDILNPLNLGG